MTELEKEIYELEKMVMFDPFEINGKTLKMTVTEYEGLITITGYEVETDKVYVLDQYEKEGASENE